MSECSKWTQVVQPAPLDLGNYHSLASSVERASTVVFPTVESLRNRDWRDERQYTYGLLGTPTTKRLERKLALIEGGEHCLLLPSGLAAISLIFIALLKAGDRVLLPNNVYEPAIDCAKFLCKQYGIEMALYDPLSPATIALTDNTRLIWVETPGSVVMEVADLPQIAALAKARGITVAVDSTWSAGISMPPFELGADISIQALTKYQSGGSDILMGSIVTRDQKIHVRLLEAHMRLGIGVSPEDCNTILRSLPHYKLRYAAQDAAARQIAYWLSEHPAIAEVLHPALPNAPGHALWQRDFTGAASLFSIVFKPEFVQSQVDACINQLKLFRIGFGWGGSVSLAVPYDMNRMRTNWSDKGSLVRLYVGLEDAQDLIHDLQQALNSLG